MVKHIVLFKLKDEAPADEKLAAMNSFKAAIEDQELGNCVRVSTGFKGVMTGNITKLDFKFSRRKITAEVTVK